LPGTANTGAGATAIGAAAAARAADPYAKELWEATCLEGNLENVNVSRQLGFKWFDAVTPPKN